MHWSALETEMDHPARAILLSVTSFVAAGCSGTVDILSIVLGLDGFAEAAEAVAGAAVAAL